MDEEDCSDKLDLPHHHQAEFCRTRPAYRQGRKLTAVKSYTISSESTHLLIFGVPKINLRQELKSSLQKCGVIKILTATINYPTEQFTECFHVNFERLSSARYAKKILDMKNFYGGILHVCYAPELETLQETKEKLYQRRLFIKKQLDKISKSKNDVRVAENVQNIYKNYPSHDNLKKIDAPVTSYVKCIPTTSFVDTNSISVNPSSSCTPIDNILIVNQSSPIPVADKTMSFPNKRCIEMETTIKRKKKKTLPNNPNSELNESQIKTISESSNVNHISNHPGNVVAFETSEKPKIVNVPRKTPNKIIVKINSKLI